MITDIFSSAVRSYRDLPLNLYHIQWKFRDEIRPRFGVMRGREFLMKDGYSFDVDVEAARRAYLAVDAVDWDGGFWRSDIGHRAIMVEEA